MPIKDEIKKFIDGEILDDEKSLEFYSRDASLFEVRPELVILPKTVYDIKNLVHLVMGHKRQFPKSKLSLTARAAGTDMTGGPLNDSIILEFNKYFNRLIEIGDDYALVQPGMYYLEFEKATLKKDLLLPCYPSSRAICSVGGMVGNNAGGEKTLAYGNTEKFVLELKVVLADGNEYSFKPLNKDELDKKMAQDDFEGNIYKKVHQILVDNKELIESSKPKVTKNSSGYYLWDIWDGKRFDLTKLFVGSQGTLGIITQIKFKLIKPKKQEKLLVIFLDDFSNLGEIANEILKFNPESFECYDDQTLKVAIKYIKEIIEYLKKNQTSSSLNNHTHLDNNLSVRFKACLLEKHPKLTLLAQFSGDDIDEVEKRVDDARKSLERFKIDSLICRSKEEMDEYWAIRRESYNLLRHHSKDKHAAPFIEDIIVTADKLPEFLPKLEEILSEYKIVYTLAGHIGDAHFHIIPLMDLSNREIHEVIPDLSKRVFDLVLEFGGSIAGEHNDGLIRSPFVKQMYGEKMYQIFVEIKKLFDPKNIFNPRKKINLDLDYAIEHIEA